MITPIVRELQQYYDYTVDAPTLRVTVRIKPRLGRQDFDRARELLKQLGFRFDGERREWAWTPRAEDLAGGGAGTADIEAALAEVKGFLAVEDRGDHWAVRIAPQALAPEDLDRVIAVLRPIASRVERDQEGRVVWVVPKAAPPAPSPPAATPAAVPIAPPPAPQPEDLDAVLERILRRGRACGRLPDGRRICVPATEVFGVMEGDGGAVKVLTKAVQTQYHVFTLE